jgi:hypothetical protein
MSAELAEQIERAVERAVEEVRQTGALVRVDGRNWREAAGAVLRLSTERLLDGEDAARGLVRKMDPALLEHWDAEAEDYRAHSRALRLRFPGEERTSRRMVSVLPPPKCPSAIQVLRGRKDALHVLGFMRSERAVPLLPLDVLNHLWVAWSVVGMSEAVTYRETRLTLLIGSLHLEEP